MLQLSYIHGRHLGRSGFVDAEEHDGEEDKHPEGAGQSCQHGQALGLAGGGPAAAAAPAGSHGTYLPTYLTHSELQV